MSGEGIIAAARPFAIGSRVLVEHPRYGRHYGRITGEGDHAEQIFDVQIEGGYVNSWQVLGAWMSPAAEGQRDMVIGDLLNLVMLKEAIEVEFLGSLWTKGDSGLLTPYVCDTSFGDGMHLLTIYTINQRPNYHVVRACSSWRESFGANRWTFVRDDSTGEHIDEVITAIEEECGRRYFVDEECETCGPEGYDCHCGDGEPWPAIDGDDGCSWGEIRWDWLMKTIGYSAMLDRVAA